MPSDNQSIEQLHEYLRLLKPEARSMLLQELERDLLRGVENGANELILQELRRAIRAEAQPVPRIGDAARMFFIPLEPFLADARPDHNRIGRIARGSLESIWAWIARDLIPAETKALSEDINRALLAGDRTRADQQVRALHSRAIARMKESMVSAAADEKTRRRIAVEVGTPRALDDIATIIAVLSLRDALADFAKRVPSHARSLDRDQADSIKTALDQAVQAAGDDRKSDLMLYGLLLVMARLAAPWQLVRIASRGAESDAAARIVASPYAVAVTIVLGETEYMVGELRTELKARRPIVSLLKGIHDAVRGLRAELDLSVDSPWGRQLAAVCAEVSSLLKAEIEAAPGVLRRLLRPRQASEIEPGAALDPLDVAEAQMRVELVGACRHYAGELAISEVTTRAYSDMTLYLETGTKVLVDALRHASDADRPFRYSQVDAAIRLCRVVFGNDYAGSMVKAAEIAAQAAAERKAMPA